MKQFLLGLSFYLVAISISYFAIAVDANDIADQKIDLKKLVEKLAMGSKASIIASDFGKIDKKTPYYYNIIPNDKRFSRVMIGIDNRVRLSSDVKSNSDPFVELIELGVNPETKMTFENLKSEISCDWEKSLANPILHETQNIYACALKNERWKYTILIYADLSDDAEKDDYNLTRVVLRVSRSD